MDETMEQAENPEGQKINVEQDEMYALQPDFALMQLPPVTSDTKIHNALGSGRNSNHSPSSMSFASSISTL